MTIRIRCGTCGKEFTAPDHTAGTSTECSHCQAAVEVPRASKSAGKADDYDFQLEDLEDTPVDEQQDDYDVKPEKRKKKPKDKPKKKPAREYGLKVEKSARDRPASSKSRRPDSSSKREYGLAGEGSSPQKLPKGRLQRTGILGFVLRNKLLTAVLIVNVLSVLLGLALVAKGTPVLAGLIVVPGLIAAALGRRRLAYRLEKLLVNVLFFAVISACLVFGGLVLVNQWTKLQQDPTRMVIALFMVLGVTAVGNFLLRRFSTAFRRIGLFRIVGWLYVCVFGAITGSVIAAMFSGGERDPVVAIDAAILRRLGAEDAPAGALKELISESRTALIDSGRLPPAILKNLPPDPGDAAPPPPPAQTQTQPQTPEEVSPPLADAAWPVQPDPLTPPARPLAEKPIPIGAADVLYVGLSNPNAGQAVILHSATTGQLAGAYDKSNQELCWLTRHDLFAGKFLGRMNLPPGSRLLDVSPSGQRAAVMVGSGGTRLDVLSLPEGRLLAVWQGDSKDKEAQGDSANPPIRYFPSIQWAGFVGETHLVLADDTGQTVAWELPQCREIFRFKASIDKSSPVRSMPFLTPGRRYLAVFEKTRLRFLDSQTGDVKGDLVLTGPGTGQILGPVVHAFSPDGRRLALMAPPAWNMIHLEVWDLAEGKCTWHGAFEGYVNPPLQWCDETHLMMAGSPYSGGRFQLVDLTRGGVVSSGQLQRGWATGQRTDDRQWVVCQDAGASELWLAQAPCFGRLLAAQIDPSLPPEATTLIGTGTTVSLQVQEFQMPGLPSDFQQQVQARLEKILKNSGTQISPGQPVTLLAERVEGRGRLAFVDSAGQTIWELQQPAGPTTPPGESAPDGPSDADRLRHFFLDTFLPSPLFAPLKDAAGESGSASTAFDVKTAFGLATDAGGSLVGPTLASQARQLVVYNVYLDVIAGDDANLQTQIRWFPGARRPSIGLRWAIAIQTAEGSDVFRIDSSDELVKHAGPIGPKLVQGLLERAANGQFGAWPVTLDPRFGPVVVLGGGPPEKLLEAARAWQIDAALLIDTTAAPGSPAENPQQAIQIHLVDVPKAATLLAMESSGASPPVAAGALKQTLDSPEITEVFEKIDAGFALVSMPSMKPEHVATRLATLESLLAHLRPREQLLVLTELRYYQSKQLASAQQVIPIYDAILGASQGTVMATGEPEQRRQVLQQWLDNL